MQGMLTAGDRGLVMVVDDDAMSRLTTSEALRQAGFDVLEAQSGEEAVQAFTGHDVDLVLLDVMMPGIDGFETCRRLRMEPRAQLVPVVMMTGLDDVDSITRAYDLGATDFISKPINLTVLRYRVQYILRSARTARELTSREAQLAAAQRIAKLGHFRWEPGTGRFICSAEVESFFGKRSGDIVTHLGALLGRVHADDRPMVLEAFEQALDSGASVSLDYRIVLDGRPLVYVHHQSEIELDEAGRSAVLIGTMQDITDRRNAEEEIRQLANFDSVTGLPNRHMFRRQLEQAIEGARRRDGIVAVLSMDLDHFKRINDSLGHARGDELLREVSRRLAGCMRASDVMHPPESAFAVLEEPLARLGGDEFSAILTDIGSPEEAAVVARRIRQVLRRPFEIAGNELELTASIGISAFPLDGCDPDDLITLADAAMNHAKAEGRDRCQFSTASINTRAFQRLSLESNMRNALREGQFCVYYQPKVDVASGRVVGAEALARWRHPELGIVSPGEFVPVAEETGLIRPISEQLFTEVCAQLATWRAQGRCDLPVSVNLSPAQFEQPGLDRIIAGIIAAARVPAAILEFEVTESLLMRDVESAVAILNALRETGASLSIDDFGTGYSSLAYLKQFPVGALKIDRSFVSQMECSADDEAIVRAVVGLAHSIGMKVVAEGVETETQLARLAAMGCDSVQGYLYSRPLPADEFIAWADAFQESSSTSARSGSG